MKDFLANVKKLISRILSDSKINYFFVIALMFLFSYPNVLTGTQYFRYLRISQSLLTLISIPIWLIYFRKNKFINALVIFYIYFLAVTIIKKGDIDSFIYYFTNSFGWLVISSLLFKYNKRIFFEATSDYYFVLLALHVITSFDSQLGLLVEESVNQASIPVYFLGQNNQLTFIVVSYFTTILVSYFVLNDGLYKVILGGLASLISIGFTKSFTGILGLAIMLLFLLITIFLVKDKDSSYVKQEKKGNYIGLISILAVLLANLSLVVFRLQKIFDPILKSIFNKDATFSTRTGIWDAALNKINEFLIFGYGAIKGRYIYIFSTAKYFDPHNLFLELLLKGGIILLALFFLLTFLSIKNIFEIRNSKVRWIFFGFLVSFFVMSLSEVYSYRMIFWMLHLTGIVGGFYKSYNKVDSTNITLDR